MSWLRRFTNRWRERDLAEEFDEELRFHLSARAEANRRRRLTPAEAEAEARRHLGNMTRAKEDMREARVMTGLDGLGGDLRHGVRVLRRQPLLTCLVVLTLSLGIGANAAIFAVSRGQIANLILRQGLWKGGIGVAIGLVGAAILSRSMTTLLFNVRPTDPAVYAAVSFVLIAVALLASYLPARRAARIDPLIALREE